MIFNLRAVVAQTLFQPRSMEFIGWLVAQSRIDLVVNASTLTANIALTTTATWVLFLLYSVW
jgi:hypothetical protein